MSTLADLLGHDNAAWMADPGRNCRPPSDKPVDIRLFADMWHPSEATERESIKLCRGCPVAASCAAWAVPQPDLEGIWGGTTPAMRRKLRTKERAA